MKMMLCIIYYIIQWCLYTRSSWSLQPFTQQIIKTTL